MAVRLSNDQGPAERAPSGSPHTSAQHHHTTQQQGSTAAAQPQHGHSTATATQGGVRGEETPKDAGKGIAATFKKGKDAFRKHHRTSVPSSSAAFASPSFAASAIQMQTEQQQSNQLNDPAEFKHFLQLQDFSQVTFVASLHELLKELAVTIPRQIRSNEVC